jgi:hypothetical protein
MSNNVRELANLIGRLLVKDFNLKRIILRIWDKKSKALLPLKKFIFVKYFKGI